jgi:hypothetical protein
VTTRLGVGEIARLRAASRLVAVAQQDTAGFVESGRATFIAAHVTHVLIVGREDDEGFVVCLAGDECVFVHVDELEQPTTAAQPVRQVVRA